MSIEQVEVAVVGGGQAGIALSDHLSNAGVPHVIAAELRQAGRRVSGAKGGHTVDFRDLAAQGITLAGQTASYGDGTVRFRPDLRDNIAAGDANYLSLLDEADAYIARNGLDLPEEPAARVLGSDPDCVTSPLRELHLASAGVTSVIRATGYAAYDAAAGS